MRCPRQLVAVLIALTCLTACASTGPRDVSGWTEARGADLMDIFGLRIAVGPGLGATVRVTEALQFGYMAMGQAELSLPSPKGVSLRGFPAVVFGMRGRYGGIWYESSQELMLPGFSSRDYGARTVHDRPIQREVISGYVTPHGQHDNWQYEIGLGAHFLAVGVQAEVRLLEALDFLAGLLSFDPAGDDLPGLAEAEADVHDDSFMEEVGS